MCYTVAVWTFLLLPPNWRDSPHRALATSAVRREVSLSPAGLLHPLIFSSKEESLLFLSSRLIRGLPTGLPSLWILDSTNKSVCNLSFRLSISIYISIYLPTYLSIYPSIHPSIYLSIHPSVHLSIHPSIHLHRMCFTYVGSNNA